MEKLLTKEEVNVLVEKILFALGLFNTVNVQFLLQNPDSREKTGIFITNIFLKTLDGPEDRKEQLKDSLIPTVVAFLAVLGATGQLSLLAGRELEKQENNERLLKAKNYLINFIALTLTFVHSSTNQPEEENNNEPTEVTEELTNENSEESTEQKNPEPDKENSIKKVGIKSFSHHSNGNIYLNPKLIPVDLKDKIEEALEDLDVGIVPLRNKMKGAGGLQRKMHFIPVFNSIKEENIKLDDELKEAITNLRANSAFQNLSFGELLAKVIRENSPKKS